MHATLPSSDERAAPALGAEPAELASPRLQRAQRSMSFVAAVVLGLFIASVSVFLTFLLFNFILHWGS